jgi:hypothetical protein
VCGVGGSVKAGPLSERIAYFSICSLNYLHFARTLAQSLRAAVPRAELLLFIADRWNDAAVAAAPEVHAIPVEAIGIPNLLDMAFRYDILEFNTSVKPFCFDYLLDQMGFDRAIYLDPDIYVLKPLDHVLQAFADGADCILTPHITQPIDDGRYPGEIELLMAGVFNLGFAAFANSPASHKFLAWWRQKLATGCLRDPPNGIFVDQRYCDFAPAFIERMAVLRHPGYNLAYWNLPYLPVEKSDGGYAVCGQPVRFVHFSGIDPQRPDLFSRFQDRFRRADLGALGTLYDEYLARLEMNDSSSGLQFSKIPYGFGAFASGAPIQPATRLAYRTASKESVFHDDPFSLSPEVFEPGATTSSDIAAAHSQPVPPTAQHAPVEPEQSPRPPAGRLMRVLRRGASRVRSCVASWASSIVKRI